MDHSAVQVESGLAVERRETSNPASAPSVARPRRGPGSRADADHPTRMRISECAAALLDTQELSGRPVADLAREAGVAKGTFCVHVAHRDDFVLAPHRWLHDELVGVIEEATAPLPRGTRRLRARLQAFLDGCRLRSGVRWLHWSTSRHPAIRSEMERRDNACIAATATSASTKGHRSELLAAAISCGSDGSRGRALARLERAGARRCVGSERVVS